MFRGAFRVVCMLLLATIIVDVTNTRCFKNSLTYRFSKQIGALRHGKTVAKFLGRANDKFVEAWKEKDFSKIYKDVSTYCKINSRFLYQWIRYFVDNFCLLLDTVRLGENHKHEYRNPRHHTSDGKKSNFWKYTGMILYGDKNMKSECKKNQSINSCGITW